MKEIFNSRRHHILRFIAFCIHEGKSRHVSFFCPIQGHLGPIILHSKEGKS